MALSWLTIENIESSVEKFKKNLYSNDRVYLDIFAIYTLFVAYFYFNWIGTGPHVPYDVLWKIVQPFNSFMSEGLSISLFESGWEESGRQFFLFPILAITGATPLILKLIPTAVYALVGPILYLALREKFGFYSSYAVGLLLITIRSFQKWRTADMYLFFFITMLTLYLYVKWDSSEKHIYLYTIMFLTSIGFYIMPIAAYPGVALLIATLITRFKTIQSMRLSTYLKLLSSLFIGILPLLIYSISLDFANLNLGWTIRNYPGLWEALIERYEQFQIITAASPPVAGAEMQEGFHIYSLMFITGVIISALKKTGFTYVLAFLIVFIMSTFTPDSHLPIHQLMVIYPFFLIVVAQNFDILEKIKLGPLLPLVLIGVMIITSGFMHGDRIHPGSVTIEEYQGYEKLDTADKIITNHRHAYAITEFDRETSGKILANESWEFNFFASEEHSIALNKTVEKFEKSDYSLLLLKEGPCETLFYGAQRCGFNTTKVADKTNLKTENADVFKGPRERRTYYYFQ